MIVTKPGWVHNEGNPIFSIDFHPDGQRFATGGYGSDCGRVAIWNSIPVIKEKCEDDENIPKLLCQLLDHLSCVNCVRWNHSGKLLASGGDDKLIIIWAFGDDKWRSVGTLTGHTNDVLDLSWSFSDRWLASCSVDNSIIVWNADKISEIVCRLVGHSGLVKGITWDPLGQYLASQSDDKTIRIWKTIDWNEQTVIHEPFKHCGNMTHVLRLNWSPDGQYLVSAHATNGGGPTARIIETNKRPIREKSLCWEMDFVGHRKAVTCVKFNPNILFRLQPDGTPIKYCVLATGSRDCGIAIWSTARRRPITVINNLFSKSVLDLSWSKDGMQLMACSWDGTVAHFQLNENILGGIISENDKNSILKTMYGKEYIPQVIPSVECFDLIKNKQKVTPDEQKKSPPRRALADVIANSKQIEMRTTDGKRRITPITIPKDCVKINKDFFSTSSPATTQIKVVKVDPPQKKNELNYVPANVSKPPEKGNYNLPKFDKPCDAALASGTTINISDVPNASLEIKNTNKGHFSSIKKLMIHVNNASTVFWERNFDTHILCVKSNKSFTVVICLNEKMYVLETDSGNSLQVPIKIPGAPLIFELNDIFCGVVTTSWTLLVWNLVSFTNTIILSNINTQLMNANDQIIALSFCDSGDPLVTLSSGCVYAHSDFGWYTVFNPNDRLGWVACQYDIVKNTLINKTAMVKMATFTRGYDVIKETGSSMDPRICTYSYLENNVQISFLLKRCQEYKDTIGALINFSAAEGLTKKLESILFNLFECCRDNFWRFEKLGISKEEMFDVVNTNLKSNMLCQRLFNEFLQLVQKETPESLKRTNFL